MSRIKPLLWNLGVFIVSGLLATNYTLNHFYVNGGYMLDSGWFAYLFAHSTSWPISNPTSLGGTYFSTHFSPALYIFSILYQILNNAGIGIPDVVWFSIIQGFWFALAASSVFLLLLHNANSMKFGNAFIAATSIAVAYNGVFLASIGFPHFEIAIPVLLVAFFACKVSGHWKLGLVFLLLGLLMREDAGFHYSGLFFLLAGYLYVKEGLSVSREVRFYFVLAVICFLYSIGAISIQKTYFNVGDNALVRVYLGDPVFSHITLDFIQERLRFFVANRLYILVPIVLMIFFAIKRNSWELLVGVGAVLPWIVFSFLAISFQAGTLTSYYSFPVAIALFWPAIAYALFSRQNNGALLDFSLKDILVIALSSIVFFVGSHGNHDNAPWKSFWPEWIGHVTTAHRSLDEFMQKNTGLKFIFDDSVASLLISTTTPLQWKYEMSFSPDEIKGSDAVLFQPGTWLAKRAKEIAGIAGYTYLCQVPNTRIVVLSRSDNIKKCQAIEPINEHMIDLRNNVFDYLPGWSHKEVNGRWTTGSRVLLPPLKTGSYKYLCFKGHGYLPTPSSKIFVEVHFKGEVLGRFEFSKSMPDGDRCAPLPYIEPGNDQYAGIYLKISGYSSPSSHGLSDDNRLLGFFVENIYLK